MPLEMPSAEMGTAIDAVRKAALLAQRIREGMKVMRLTKSDTSPVSVADFACQAVVAKCLSDAIPKAILVGEEGASELRRGENREMLGVVTEFVGSVIPGAQSEEVCDWIDFGAREPSDRFWTLDPIDGTKGYLRGDQYAVALALIENGSVRLGVLGCPNLGRDCSLNGGGGVLLAAEKEQGTVAAPISGNGLFTHVRVSAEGALENARLLRSLVSGHTNVDQMEEVARHMGLKTAPVALDSQAKYAMLAGGRGELLFRLLSPRQLEYKEMIWDQAAGLIVVEEAGGRVTDLDGHALDFTQGRTLRRNRGICATNGVLHEAALDALRAVG